jgi:hypothetical protein
VAHQYAGNILGFPNCLADYIACRSLFSANLHAFSNTVGCHYLCFALPFVDGVSAFVHELSGTTYDRALDFRFVRFFGNVDFVTVENERFDFDEACLVSEELA